MRNRGQIKWQAFESLYKTKEVKNELVNKRNYPKMPELSIDQYNELEETLKCAYARANVVGIYNFFPIYELIYKYQSL